MKNKIPALVIMPLLASALAAQSQAAQPQIQTLIIAAKAPALMPERFALSGVRLEEKTSDVIALHGFPTHLLLNAQSTNVTVLQAPFQKAPILQADALPEWAKAVSPSLDKNHVLWLYNRDTYALAYMIDPLGVVETVIVAGIAPVGSNEGRLENDQASVKLGDDLRKLIFRYGQPNNIESYQSETEGYRVFTLYYPLFAATVRDNRVVRLQLNDATAQN